MNRAAFVFVFIQLLVQHALAQPQFEPFQPYPEHTMRLIQGVSFSSDDQIMYFTIPHSEYLSSIARTSDVHSDDEVARLGVYQTTKTDTGWTPPALLPFSGKISQYEPTASPNDSILLFNSKQWIGDSLSTANNIWYSRLERGIWTTPKSLVNINTFEVEESYPTLSKEGKLIYAKEELIENQTIYSLYETYFDGEQTKVGTRLNLFKDLTNLSDPCLSSDEKYLLFTKFDPDNWEASCDLYMSTHKSGKWTTPVRLDKLNTSGPDFSAYLTSDGRWLYYRKNYHYVKVKFMDILSP